MVSASPRSPFSFSTTQRKDFQINIWRIEKNTVSLQQKKFNNEYDCWITINDGIITGTLPRRAAKLVFEWLDIHQQELLDNWNRLQNSEAPLKIEPLN